MVFRVYKGRKINKILCLSFFVLTLIILITAKILALVTDFLAGYTFCILALITGGFFPPPSPLDAGRLAESALSLSARAGRDRARPLF